MEAFPPSPPVYAVKSECHTNAKDRIWANQRTTSKIEFLQAKIGYCLHMNYETQKKAKAKSMTKCVQTVSERAMSEFRNKPIWSSRIHSSFAPQDTIGQV